MKKQNITISKACAALLVVGASFLTACQQTELVDANSTDTPALPELEEEILKGEILIKFKPEYAGMLKQTTTNGTAAKSRSAINNVDEVLQTIKAYEFTPVFPVDKRHVERTAKSGLDLWYSVKFDKSVDVKTAAKQLMQLGEISKIQANYRQKRNMQVKPRLLNDNTLGAIKSRSAAQNDPKFCYQWNLQNLGEGTIPATDVDGSSLNTTVSPMLAGADVNVAEAWEKCKGDPSIIVAVIDEAVMYTHEDLRNNMWRNPGESDVTSNVDHDGNGYAGDVYGYNFAEKTGYLSWSGAYDVGHGTHVAGVIAAESNNGVGIAGIAGGDGTPGSGVKIMSCQVYSGAYSVDDIEMAKAIKYACDNGAVILQCSWGANSNRGNMIDGFDPSGIADDDMYEQYMPLLKEAFDYFIHNAGDANGVIDGGVVVFSAGNEYASQAGYPAAYKDYIAVAAMASDYTPASYTCYGLGVDITAPGGDEDYTQSNEGSILSTVPGGKKEGSYAYMNGTSMACPHVSGVAALALSYAKQQGKHLKADEFKQMIINSARKFDHLFGTDNDVKSYSYGWATIAAPKDMNLGSYKNKMGGLVDATALFAAIDNGGVAMRIPNVYVAPGATATIDIEQFINVGNAESSTVSVADTSVATATALGHVITINGVAAGLTKATINVGGTTHTINITVRANGGQGWL